MVMSAAQTSHNKNKQPSFIGRWLESGPQKDLQNQQHGRSSFLTTWFDKKNSPFFGSRIDGAKLERQELVERLTNELNSDGDDGSKHQDNRDKDGQRIFKLTEDEVRLLLELPLKQAKTPTLSGPGDGFLKPTAELLPETSEVFDGWDFTSQEELSADEVQAVLIALAAAEESEGKESLPKPASLSDKARSVSIQPMVGGDPTEGPQFLVTLADGTRSNWRPSIPEALPDLAKESFTNARPTMAARMYSIQALLAGKEEKPLDQPLQDKMKGQGKRRASVQCLQPCTKTGAQQYVITLPGTPTWVPNTTGSSNDKSPNPVARQLSVRPCTLGGSSSHHKTDIVMNEDNSGQNLEPPKPPGRRVSVRMNGKNVEEYHLHKSAAVVPLQ